MRSLVFLICVALIAATAVFADQEATCSPWLGYCQTYEQCCRDLECATYLLKCVPIHGLKIPGKDKRPIGPPPYYQGP